MAHSYPLIRASHGLTPSGIAVQDGDYESIDPRNGKTTTITDLIRFATDYLRVDYIFWCTQEPYYSNKLIPFLTKTGERPHRAGRVSPPQMGSTSPALYRPRYVLIQN